MPEREQVHVAQERRFRLRHPTCPVKCIERLISLYSAWHAAEPEEGYDAKAAEWRAKLPQEATSQPTK